jgi:hypothetical protein
MGYTVTAGNWSYSDTPTKNKSGDDTVARVTPDTRGGTNPPPGSSTGTIAADAVAKGPDISSSAEAATDASMDITFTWMAPPATPTARDFTITVTGTPSYQVSATAVKPGSATAEAKAVVSISDGTNPPSTAVIYDDTETAPGTKTSAGGGSSVALKTSKFSVADLTEKYSVKLSVTAKASRKGEGAVAQARAQLDGVTVSVV